MMTRHIEQIPSNIRILTATVNIYHQALRYHCHYSLVLAHTARPILLMVFFCSAGMSAKARDAANSLDVSTRLPVLQPNLRKLLHDKHEQTFISFIY